MITRKKILGWRGLAEYHQKKFGCRPRSDAQIWRDIAGGRFPAPIEEGPNAISWWQDEVDAHYDNLPRRTYGAGTAHRQGGRRAKNANAPQAA